MIWKTNLFFIGLKPGNNGHYSLAIVGVTFVTVERVGMVGMVGWQHVDV